MAATSSNDEYEAHCIPRLIRLESGALGLAGPIEHTYCAVLLWHVFNSVPKISPCHQIVKYGHYTRKFVDAEDY